MTLKEFAEKRIVHIIPCVTLWGSFIGLFMTGLGCRGDIFLMGMIILSIIVLGIIAKIRGIEPPERTGQIGQSFNDRLTTDPIYRHLPGNINHRSW